MLSLCDDYFSQYMFPRVGISRRDLLYHGGGRRHFNPKLFFFVFFEQSPAGMDNIIIAPYTPLHVPV